MDVHGDGVAARKWVTVVVLLASTVVLAATSPALEWEDLGRSVVSVLAVLDDERPRLEVEFELAFSEAVLDGATSLTLSTRQRVFAGAVDDDVPPLVTVLGRDGEPCSEISCLDGGGTFVVERDLRWGDEPVIVAAELRVDVEGRGAVPGSGPDGHVRVAAAMPVAAVLETGARGTTDDLADDGRWKLSISTDRPLDPVEAPVLRLRGVDAIAELQAEDGSSTRLSAGVTRVPLPEGCFRRACTATFALAVAASAPAEWGVWAEPGAMTMAAERSRDDDREEPAIGGRLGEVTVEADPILPVDRRKVIRLRVPASVLDASDAEEGPLVTLRMNVIVGDGDSRATLSVANGSPTRLLPLTAPPTHEWDLGGVSGHPCGPVDRTDGGDCVLDFMLLRTSPPSTAVPTVVIDAVLDSGDGSPPRGWESATLEVLP